MDRTVRIIEGFHRPQGPMFRICKANCTLNRHNGCVTNRQYSKQSKISSRPPITVERHKLRGISSSSSGRVDALIRFRKSQIWLIDEEIHTMAQTRTPKKHSENQKIKEIIPHPLFIIREGPPEIWEKSYWREKNNLRKTSSSLV